MAPRESQFKEFNNTIAKISNNIDSGKVGYTEIYEEIKNQLRENLSTVYEEWKNSQFNPSFRFKLHYISNRIIETTLLHRAINCRKKEAACVPLIQCLLEKGANFNIRDSNNQTPLSSAVYTEEDKNKEVVKLLLDAEADPNAMNASASDLRTPLSIACRYSDESLNVEAAKLLLEKGANVNEVVDNRENTVLHRLINQSFIVSDSTPILKKQLPGLIKLLIKCGANIYAQNSGCFTPESGIENRLRTYRVKDKEFVISIQKFLKEQKDSIEYHRKLFEVVEQNKDLELLTDIIRQNGLISTRGLQVCSKAIPQILGIPGIKLAVKGTIVDGEIEQESSQGTGWHVIKVEGNSLKYYDLFDKIIAAFPRNPVIGKLHVRFLGPPKELMSTLVTMQELCKNFKETSDKKFFNNLKQEFSNLDSLKNTLNDEYYRSLYTITAGLCTFVGMLEITLEEEMVKSSYTELNNELVPIKQKLCDFIKQLRKEEQKVEERKEEDLMYKVCRYIRENTEAIKQELWGEPRVSSTSSETTEVEGNTTTQHVTQKEPAVKQHVKKKTKGDTSEERGKKINDTSHTDNEPMVTGRFTFNSSVYSQKEPPIFSRKQKIAIAVGIVAALATALVCYSVQLPILAIVVSALIVGVGAYMVSSKLHEVVVCNGTNQQPSF